MNEQRDMQKDKPGEDRMEGLVLETSASCQLNCPFCFLRSYNERPDPAYMPLAVAEAVLPHLEGLSSIDLTGWGEPLRNPQFFDIVRAVREKFSGTLTVTTNGLLLDSASMHRLIDQGIDTVCVSVDAATEKSYKAVRQGGQFGTLRKVMDEFSAVREERRAGKPLLFATFLLRRGALSELDDFVCLVSGHGLDGVVFQQLTGVFNEEGLKQVTHSNYYYNQFDEAELERRMEEARQAAPEGFIVVGPEKVRAQRVGDCGGFDLSRPFITASGDVSVCCAMAYPCSLMRRDRQLEKTEAVIFGNVLDRPLPEIWSDEKYARARAEIRSGSIPQACGDCIALYIERGEVYTAPEE